VADVAPLLQRDPRRIDEYRLAGRLGAGGMGVVYLGWSGDTPVAVKVMRNELAEDPHFRARFRREVDVLRRIGGTCTVRVLDADADADAPFVVTDFVDGPNLHTAVAEGGPLRDETLRGLAAGLAEALQAIHAAGIVHRDLKPSNVLLSKAGPRVIDFGIAQVADATSLTSSTSTLGTPGYLAPEQIRGLSNTAAADVFAWGATLAYAATGTPPFGLGATDAVLFRVLHQPAALDDWDDARVRPLVEAALHKEPSQRPTPDELLGHLLDNDMTVRLPVDQATAVLLERTWVLTGARTAALPLPPDEEAVAPVSVPALRARRLLSAQAISTATLVGVLLGGASLAVSRPAERTDPVAVAPAGAASSPTTTTPPTADLVSPDPAPPAQPAQALWPRQEEFLDVAESGSPPSFPNEVEGYRLVDFRDQTVRAFTGEQWSTFMDFGHTMNGCANQRFLVRWRSLDPDAVIESTRGYDPEEFPDVREAPVAGSAGHMAMFGCEQPWLRQRSAQGGSTLVDVVVEVQRYEPRV
jgi:predicted Ser/Thr protein kinase